MESWTRVEIYPSWRFAVLAVASAGTRRATDRARMTTPPMTTTDIAALAREAGLAGRDWNSWCCDDVVQSYVDEHGADADAWEAAYAEGEMERRRTIEGWIERWTTAPVDYDSFGTTTVAVEGEWRKRTLRRVLMHPHHASYQADRYGSGLHGTWDEDPREADRRFAEQVARDRAAAEQYEADRAAGLAWLANASDADLDVMLEADEPPRGVARTDVRTEQRRRVEVRETTTREAEYDRCRGLVTAHEVLVDDGRPAMRGRWGVVPGRSSRVYYAVSVDEWPRDAERASVHASGKDAHERIVGSLATVAKRLDEGSLRGVRAAAVPPEPVLRRIGHEHLAGARAVVAAVEMILSSKL